MDIGTFILCGVLFYVAAQIVLGLHEGFQLVKFNDRLEVMKKLNDIIHQVLVEKHGDVEYWYDKDSKEFLGQGTTLEEVANALRARFPDHIFLLKEEYTGRHGGIARQTDWKLMVPEEFNKIQIHLGDM